MRKTKRVGSDFPSRCAMNATAKETFLLYARIRRRRGNSRIVVEWEDASWSASQLLSPGNACAPSAANPSPTPRAVFSLG
jgi:hypothetical protein